MTQKTRRLGRGLSSLIQSDSPVKIDTVQNTYQMGGAVIPRDDAGPAAHAEASRRVPRPEVGGVRMIDLEEVRPSPFQPRRHFDDTALGQLAESIRRSGLLQPIIVRPVVGGFELIAGERRLRAARLAGLRMAPAVVREVDDEQAAEWGLIENIQREDLNPIERGHGLRALAERFGLAQAELGVRVGLDRSTVANLIRLTELEEEIQAMVAGGALSMGHGRALLGVAAGESRLHLARRAVEQAWSVRQIEAAARESPEGPRSKNGTSANAGQTQRAAIIGDLERRIADHLATKAHIRLRPKGNRGRLIVEFYSLEHFEDVMRRLGLPDESMA